MLKKLHNIAGYIVKSEKKKGLPAGKAGKVDVSLVDDRLIRSLNRRFRKLNKATDVLSFYFGEYGVLGDVIISLDTAKRNALRFKSDLDRELKRLVIHGTLHLLGYDHMSKSDRILMGKREELYAKKIR